MIMECEVKHLLSLSEEERELHYQREMIERQQDMALGEYLDRLKHSSGSEGQS